MAALACEIAALLEGPEISRGNAKADIDLDGQLAVMRGEGRGDAAARSRIQADARRLQDAPRRKEHDTADGKPGGAARTRLPRPHRTAARGAADVAIFSPTTPAHCFRNGASSRAMNSLPWVMWTVPDSKQRSSSRHRSPGTRSKHTAPWSIVATDELFWDDTHRGRPCPPLPPARCGHDRGADDHARMPTKPPSCCSRRSSRAVSACLPWQRETERRPRTERVAAQARTGGRRSGPT